MGLAETGINTSDRSDHMTTSKTCHSKFSKNLFPRHAIVTWHENLTCVGMGNNLAGTAGELLSDEDAGHEQRGGTAKKKARR